MSLKHLRVYLIGDFIRAEASGEEQGGCADEGGPVDLRVGFHIGDVVSEKGGVSMPWFGGGVGRLAVYRRSAAIYSSPGATCQAVAVYKI